MSVSYYHNQLSSMYQKNSAGNLAYASHWYPPPNASGYPSAAGAPSMHHAAANGQYLSGLDGDAAAAAYYSQHHPMFTQASPDWSGHDNYGQSMMPPSMITPAMANGGSHAGQTPVTAIGADDLEHLASGGLTHDAPPSPPNTVGSGSSEMSSPTMTNGVGNTPINDSASPHHPNDGRPKSPYDWMKKASYTSQPLPGRTRTKDKYRVVYTDYQRLELEKEFHTSRYITIRRKTELATSLQLSERQVKIWFQNRRAKDRKQTKKRGGRNDSFEEALAYTHNPLMHLHSNGVDIKPKMEPGFMSSQHSQYGNHLHNMHHHHSLGHSMHQMNAMSAMSSMGPMGSMGSIMSNMGSMSGGMGSMGSMGLHNSLAGLHLHHSPADTMSSPSPHTATASEVLISTATTPNTMSSQQQSHPRSS